MVIYDFIADKDGKIKVDKISKDVYAVVLHVDNKDEVITFVNKEILKDFSTTASNLLEEGTEK